MKRRILSLALAAVLLCSTLVLTSCESAESLLEKAMEKTHALESYEVKTEIEMELSASGAKVELDLVQELKASGLKGENPVSYAKTKTTAMDQTVETEAYVEGDWVYIKTAGVGSKRKLSEVKDEFDYQGELEDMTKLIPAELLAEVEIVKNSDGSKTVALDIPEDQFSEIFKDMVDSIQESAVAQLTVDSVEITDPSVSITVKDGYISVYDIEFKMAITVQGTTMNCDIKTSTQFINPGEEVKAEPMSGYQSYPEASEH